VFVLIKTPSGKDLYWT